MSKQSLHTLDDAGSEDYLHENLSEPLIPNEVPNAPFNDQYHRVPRQADYENMYANNQYYIQQSIEESSSLIYAEDKRCYSLSPVRRMFCLLSLFDCLLTFLMWVIYLQVIVCVILKVFLIRINVLIFTDIFLIFLLIKMKCIFFLWKDFFICFSRNMDTTPGKPIISNVQ